MAGGFCNKLQSRTQILCSLRTISKGLSPLRPAALHTGSKRWLWLPKVLLQQFQAMQQWEPSTMQTRCWREPRRVGLLSAWRRARPPALRPEWESGGRSWLSWAGGRTSWLPIKNSAKRPEPKKWFVTMVHCPARLWSKSATNSYFLLVGRVMKQKKKIPQKVPGAWGDIIKWLVFIKWIEPIQIFCSLATKIDKWWSFNYCVS